MALAAAKYSEPFLGAQLAAALGRHGLHDVVSNVAAQKRFPLPHTFNFSAHAHLYTADAELYERVARAGGCVWQLTLPRWRAHEHLLSVPPEEPWVYLQHSFEPTVSLIVDPVTPVATARATEDLVDGAALTIDYTLHEWDMQHPFRSEESGRWVGGFVQTCW